MKFLAITLIVHAPDPITGVQKSTADRFREVIGNARLAEGRTFYADVKRRLAKYGRTPDQLLILPARSEEHTSELQSQ